ncbi:hypothetical protein [Paenibacillus amylolyticus]|uniref:hypothetical protein n=1 Tax=Paenibacillus amylolyticus TaxID=1451 RepID=UPI003EBEA8F3
MKIKKITFPTPLDKLNPSNGNCDVFIQLEDNSRYTFVCTTPLGLSNFMEREGITFIPPAQPDIIVKELTEKNIQEAIESYAGGDAFWLKILSVADHSKEVFDMKIINQALSVTE